MRVLLVKLSSIGDLIHTLPALQDAYKTIPNLEVTWVSDTSCADIAAWHPAVVKVIAVPLRARKFSALFTALRELRATKYDLVIDGQGLLKSAVIARLARSKEVVGYDQNSSRESIASKMYTRSYAIAKSLHAITRLRQLFAQAFGYTVPYGAPESGIDWQQFAHTMPHEEVPRICLLHGTTWPTKHWPDEYWRQLVQLLAQRGYHMQVTWANPEQHARAQMLAQHSSHVSVLPHLTINQAAGMLYHSRAVVAVDTGFAHLAAAIGKPLVAIYGATDERKVGVVGANCHNLSSRFVCAPCERRICTYTGASAVQPACMEELTPELVLRQLLIQMES